MRATNDILVHMSMLYGVKLLGIGIEGMPVPDAVHEIPHLHRPAYRAKGLGATAGGSEQACNGGVRR